MNERFKNRLLGALCAGIVVLLLGAAAIQVYMSPLTVPTLADMQRIQPHGKIGTVRVLGITRPGDAGPPWDFRVVQTNLALTNFVQQVASVDTNWAFIHDWDGDVRKFGAIPYHPRYTLVPWGYKATNDAIGTGPFSLLITTTLPTSYRQPHGMFELGPVPSTNQSLAAPELLSSINLRASPDVWGIVFRSTTGASSAGTTVDDASVLESSPSALAVYAGQTVQIVITRSGTNAAVYFNGTDVTSLFTFSNPAGWAKSLALGQKVLAQVGNNGNVWYWPKPVTRFCLWGSALTPAEAADPESVAAKLVDFTPSITTEPPDLTTNMNSAAEFVRYRGGGKIQMPSGVYRIDGPVMVVKQADVGGDGSPPYPNTFRQGFRPGSTTIAPWFGASNAVFFADQTQSEEVCLTARSIPTLGGGVTSSRWLRARISDLTICGDLALSSEGIVLDRVAGVGIQNVGFRGVPGHAIRAYGVNDLQVFDCEGGAMGLGLDIHACADVTIRGCFFDGAKNAVLRFAANLARVVYCVLEVALNPRSSVPSYEFPVSVNTATDEFTSTNSYGHRFHTGQIIRFDPDAGTLPSVLSSTTDYFVYVTGMNTFKVCTLYADEVSKLGCYYGNSFVDITDSGSGTWYVGSGPAVGMSLTGDHNSIIGCQHQQNYEGALLVEGGNGNNSFVGNHYIMTGLGNSDTNLAAVKITGSSYNVFDACKIDDRDLAGYSQNGFNLDAASDYNSFIGCSWNIDNPYIFGDPAKQLIIDAKQSVFQWNGSYGNFYMPRGSGFTPWAVGNWTNASATFVDDSSGRVYFHTGPGFAANDTNWNYTVTSPAEGPVYWGGNSGTLGAVNNGTGQTLVSQSSTYAQHLQYNQLNDATSTSRGFEVSTFRNWAANSSTWDALPAYTKIAQLSYGGWYGSSANDVAGSAGISIWSDSLPWSSTNRGSQVNVNVTPTGTTTQTTAITFNTPTTPAAGDTMMLLTRYNGSSWVTSAKRVSTHTNDSAGVGYQALRVPN